MSQRKAGLHEMVETWGKNWDRLKKSHDKNFWVLKIQSWINLT